MFEKPGYNSNLIPMKDRCAKISENARLNDIGVNSELKTAASVESETETDSETSGPQPFTLKKREHK